jgi:hypothetical protein
MSLYSVDVINGILGIKCIKSITRCLKTGLFHSIPAVLRAILLKVTNRRLRVHISAVGYDDIIRWLWGQGVFKSKPPVVCSVEQGSIDVDSGINLTADEFLERIFTQRS